jgi:hypothetical protein
MVHEGQQPPDLPTRPTEVAHYRNTALRGETHGALGVGRKMPVDEQGGSAPDRSEIERRSPTFDLTTIRHDETPLAAATFYEHHGDGRGNPRGAAQVARPDAGVSQRAGCRATRRIVADHREHLGGAAQTRCLGQGRRDHTPDRDQALAIACTLRREVEALQDVEVVHDA